MILSSFVSFDASQAFGASGVVCGGYVYGSDSGGDRFVLGFLYICLCGWKKRGDLSRDGMKDGFLACGDEGKSSLSI